MKRAGLAQKLRYLVKRHPFLYRFRYALITELGGEDVDAAPHPPAEHRAPPSFQQVIAGLDLARDGSLEDALKIAYELSYGHRRGPGMGFSSEETLHRIYRGGAGVCSDYAQVFLGLCRTAGVAAREWGMCERFEAHVFGHAVSEVYSPRERKWIFIDSYQSVYAVSRDGAIPLSLTEIVDLMTGDRAGEIELRAIDETIALPEKLEGYLHRYFDPRFAFFLLSNNDVFKQDRFLRWARLLPLPLLHMLMIVSGHYQRFHVYTNARNREAMVAKVRELRSWFQNRVLVAVSAVTLLLLAAILWGVS